MKRKNVEYKIKKTRVGTYWLTVDEQQLQQVGHSDCVHCGHNNVTVVGIRNHGELCCGVQPLLPAHLKGRSAFRGDICIDLLSPVAAPCVAAQIIRFPVPLSSPASHYLLQCKADLLPQGGRQPRVRDHCLSSSTFAFPSENWNQRLTKRLWYLQEVGFCSKLAYAVSIHMAEGRKGFCWDPIFMFGAITSVALRYTEVSDYTGHG